MRCPLPPSAPPPSSSSTNSPLGIIPTGKEREGGEGQYVVITQFIQNIGMSWDMGKVHYVAQRASHGCKIEKEIVGGLSPGSEHAANVRLVTENSGIRILTSVTAQW
jgi:hypothetical protein